MNNEREHRPVSPQQGQSSSLPFSPVTRNGINYFWGIPYASARRFSYPELAPLENLPMGFTADTPAPGCPQPTGLAGPDIGQPVSFSEDCLKLSVMTPAHAEGTKLPVMVFFHGGSYLTGGGDAPAYDPHKLVEEQNLVVVTVTYRLGLLGFLGGTATRPANLGLLDALTALRWVKGNIERFGGDPECVTAWGQSAGGDLVARLLATPEVAEENLIHRAIIQSAPLDLGYGKQKLAKHLLAATEHLDRRAPAQVWAHQGGRYFFANPLRFGWSGFLPLGCQFGAYPLPAEEEEPVQLAQLAARVPLLVGNMPREAAGLTPEFPTALGKFLFAWGEPLTRWLTERIYTRASRNFADKYRRAGGQATVYSLETGSGWHYRRSTHSSDLSLLFDNPAWEGSALRAGAGPSTRTQQGRALRAVWASLARTGSVPAQYADAARISLA
ncbi:carboxylesterase family protein [Rothia sp. CCM 9416]|uniref:carboxylesterase family protein n=1 Tax=Rothia sp. CCM 9416 TaxID=3402655 RepID=UPI003AE47A5D